MSSFDPHEPLKLTVATSESGWRLDAFLAHHLTDYSRVHLRRVIVAGEVKVDGRGGKPSYRLQPGQRVTLTLPELPREGPTPEAIPLDILYDDDELAVVNKPAGMVVHPARGHWSGTLASALQYRYGSRLSQSGGPTRPGIVHRLDRDTSGVILVAKNDQAHAKLATQFELRSMEKEYFAITAGIPNRERDVIEEPIGPHPKIREQMAIRRNHPDAREAVTFYEVVESFPPKHFAAVRAIPKTGRTHQIRIHLNHIGAPILCDRLYGGRSQITRGQLLSSGRSDSPANETILLARQALHARRITFTHPATGERMTIEAPLPDDMEAVLAELRSDP